MGVPQPGQRRTPDHHHRRNDGWQPGAVGQSPGHVGDTHRDQHHRQCAQGTPRRYCDATTIKSSPSRPARCDTAEALMPSAAEMSFFV